MRFALLLLFIPAVAFAQAQPAWLPLSRTVEQPYTTALHHYKSTAHTALRPYRRSELPSDSLRPNAAWALLDRWAGAADQRAVRFGPLVEATAGLDAQASNTFIQRLGGGAWFEADLAKRLHLHLNGMAWQERLPRYLDSLAVATQVVPGEGYAWGAADARSHYDVQGHLSWDPGKYFNLTLGRGRHFIGEGYRSLLLSDESYSYPYLRITTTVWKVKYMNLFTRMSDLRGAGGDPSRFHGKFASMHYLSWNISPRVNLGIFEAIVWSAGDSLYPRGFDVNYLNPIIFYRPVEFSIGSPDNALLGGALNVTVGKAHTLYLQVMLDEFLLDEVRSGNGWYANKQAFQLGLMLREVFHVQGLSLRCEWNVVRPFMYTHSDTRQNYAHFGQPLAHPYGSNFQEALLRAEWQQGRWNCSAHTSMAWLGADGTASFGNNIFRPESDRPRSQGEPRNFGYRIGMNGPYTVFHGELRAGWLVDPNTGTMLQASALWRDRSAPGAETVQDLVVRAGIVCYFRERYADQEVRYSLPR
ncbi:MAG: hypothetical protein E6Q99_06015 [Elusimicrobia bacterium]|nr:MAG: hypothetical protein E6Q99_06015 [Elusimicrobiota bacterium]